MSVDDLSPAAIKPVKRRVARPLAADHVPAMLAASAAGAAPVVMPAHVEAHVATINAPVPAPPAAVPAHPQPDEDIMETYSPPKPTTDTAAHDTAAKGQAMFADMNTRAKGAMEKGQQMMEEMNSFGKSNVEALVESSKIAAKGVEALSQEAAEFARRQIEGATQAMKTLSQTKSPTELLKLQSDYTRSMFDTMVAQTTRSTELMIKLASDIAQPISNRVAVAADKMKIAA